MRLAIPLLPERGEWLAQRVVRLGEESAVGARCRTAGHWITGATRERLGPDCLPQRLAANVARRRLAGVIEHDEVLEGLQHAARPGGVALFGEWCAKDGLASGLMPTRSERLGQVVPRLGEIERAGAGRRRYDL